MRAARLTIWTLFFSGIFVAGFFYGCSDKDKDQSLSNSTNVKLAAPASRPSITVKTLDEKVIVKPIVLKPITKKSTTRPARKKVSPKEFKPIEFELKPISPPTRPMPVAPGVIIAIPKDEAQNTGLPIVKEDKVSPINAREFE